MIINLEQLLLTYTLILPRLISCFVVLPILSKSMLGGALIRNGVICSLALFIYPAVATSVPLAWTGLELAVLVAKEILLGLLIGFIASVPFWAIDAAGFIIDTQRGATMASMENPMLGGQTSPAGLLLTQTLITLFFSGGAFLVLLSALFQSYTIWPINTFYPTIGSQWIDFFYSQISQLLQLCLLLSAPLLIAMFLAEFGLALISRFAPSLNVFILSMPVKSIVASLLLVLYLQTMVSVAFDRMLLALNPVELLQPILKKP